MVESRMGAVAVGRRSSRGRQLSLNAGASVESIAPFPIPARQTGRADFPHPAFMPASSRGCRRRPSNMDVAEPGHPQLAVHPLAGEPAGASLHRHYPASSLLSPCPTPSPAAALKTTLEVRPPPCWASLASRGLPSLHAVPTTPTERTGAIVGFFPAGYPTEPLDGCHACRQLHGWGPSPTGKPRLEAH